MVAAPITEILADYVAGLRFADIPVEVLERAKQLILDFSGNAVRGRRNSEAGVSVLSALALLGLDTEGGSTVLGDWRTYSPPISALLNGSFGHSLDFDDTHADSSLHPSAPVVPAAFAAAEMAGATGAEVVTAIIAGYEVCCRLGNALNPTSHYARGFHPTATAGVFGAAAAAARIFAIPPERVVAAFGVAGSQAAGSLQFLANGSWNKPYQVGAAAMNGVVAAALARQGFRASAEPIEGPHGLLAGYTDDARPELAVAGLHSVFETMNIGLKPYPSCRYTHSALHAIVGIMREHDILPSQIREVIVGLHRNGVLLVGEPAARKRRPQNTVDGQFSMYFTAAVALAEQRFGWDDYARISDPEIQNLMDRVVVREDHSVGEDRPHPFGAYIEISTNNGQFSRLILDPPGEPAQFPSRIATWEKFLLLTRPVLHERAEELGRMILAIEEVRSFSTAMATAGRAMQVR